MKHIILILTILLIFSCNKNATKENDKNKNPKTEINSQLSKEKITDNSPVDTTLKFINSYITDCNKLKESVGYSNFVKSSKLTSNSFKTELQKIVDEA